MATRSTLAHMLASERLVTPGYRPQFTIPGKWGMLAPGNLDLKGRPVVRNRDGSMSTVRSITITDDAGRATLLPTVIGGRVVSDQQAIQHYQQTGHHLGVFPNERMADRYAQALHVQQARFYGA